MHFEEVIYFAAYIVIDAGDTDLEDKQLLTEAEYREKKAKFGNRFEAKMGAEAVKELLEQADIDKEVHDLKRRIKDCYWSKENSCYQKIRYLRCI